MGLIITILTALPLSVAHAVEPCSPHHVATLANFARARAARTYEARTPAPPTLILGSGSNTSGDAVARRIPTSQTLQGVTPLAPELSPTRAAPVIVPPEIRAASAHASIYPHGAIKISLPIVSDRQTVNISGQALIAALSTPAGPARGGVSTDQLTPQGWPGAISSMHLEGTFEIRSTHATPHAFVAAGPNGRYGNYASQLRFLFGLNRMGLVTPFQRAVLTSLETTAFTIATGSIHTVYGTAFQLVSENPAVTAALSGLPFVVKVTNLENCSGGNPTIDALSHSFGTGALAADILATSTQPLIHELLQRYVTTIRADGSRANPVILLSGPPGEWHRQMEELRLILQPILPAEAFPLNGIRDVLIGHRTGRFPRASLPDAAYFVEHYRAAMELGRFENPQQLAWMMEQLEGVCAWLNLMMHNAVGGRLNSTRAQNWAGQPPEPVTVDYNHLQNLRGLRLGPQHRSLIAYVRLLGYDVREGETIAILFDH